MIMLAVVLKVSCSSKVSCSNVVINVLHSPSYTFFALPAYDPKILTVMITEEVGHG